MHYVTCIGNRYMLLKLIPGTYYITYGYMIACMYIGIILYQSIWLCALCDLYWEQVHVATYIDTYYITSDYMTACIVHIGTYIISAHLAVCIM